MHNRIWPRRLRFTLVALLVLLVALPSAGLARDLEPATSEEIDEFVQEQMDASRIPGAALAIVDADQVTHERGFGTTADDQSVTPETLFGIGSAGKSITALATMQLVESGDIELDAPVQDYIPWFRLADQEMSAQLTVRHLLTMTSGIPATAGGEAFRSTEAQSPEEAIRALSDAEFASRPGETFEYVNANFVILGHLIEVASGESYGDYVERNIFDPLEMDNTYTDLAEAELAGLPDGHRYWFGVPVGYTMQELPALVPAGYIVSTTSDLSNFLQMYLNDGTFNGTRILSAEGIDTMLSGVTQAGLGPWADGATAEYAMGWYVGGPWGDGDTIFHPGSAPNFTSMLMLDRERGLGVATVMNSASEQPLPGAAGALRELPSGVMSILSDESPEHGAGLARFYIVFDVIVAAFVLLQAAALVRLIRRPSIVPGRIDQVQRGWWAYARFVLPLIWEIGLGVALLFVPALIAMSWQSLMLWMPDLGFVLLLIAVLWLVTGAVRAARIVGAVRTESVAESWTPRGAQAQTPSV